MTVLVWLACGGDPAQVARHQARTAAAIPADQLQVQVLDLLARGRRGEPEAFEQAEALVQEQLQLGEDARLFVLMGKVLIEQGHAATDRAKVPAQDEPFAPHAAAWLRRAVKLDPRDLSSWRLLSLWHEHNGDPEGALACDRKILELEPGRYESRAHLGRSLAALGRLEEAEVEIRRAIERWHAEAERPDFRRAEHLSALLAMHEQLGLVLMRQGHDEEAEAVLQEAVELVDGAEQIQGPADIVAGPFVALGVLYKKLGQDADRAAMSRRAADLEPHKVITQVDAALASQLVGEQELALEYARRALALKDDDTTRQLVASIEAGGEELELRQLSDAAVRAFERYDFEAAGQLVERGLEQAPGDPQLGVLRAFLLTLETRFDEAAELLDGAVASSAGIGIARGHLALGRKNYAAAERLLRDTPVDALSSLDHVAGMDPTGFAWLLERMGLTGLGWAAANQARHAEAIAHFDAVLERKPSDLFALLGKGNSKNALGELEEAERLLQRVLEIDPENPYALAELALVRLNQGDTEAAEEGFRAALSVEPETYTCPYEGLGLVYLRQGKKDRAREAFERAIAINPDIEYKKFNELARLHLEAGRLDEAERLLRKSIENHPYDDEARELLAQVEARR